MAPRSGNLRGGASRPTPGPCFLLTCRRASVWRLLAPPVLWSLAPAVTACPWCREAVRAAVVAPEALPTAGLLALPLVAVALVGAAVHRRL